MDFSRLSSNDKLAVYGAVASVIGPVLASAGFGFGAGIFTLLLALAMLAVVFLPQLSPQTTLPGSKGSLMLVVGGIAAISAALALLTSIGWLGLLGDNVIFVLGWLIGIAGGLLMGWAGWQEFQAEGGKFQLGSAATAPGTDAPRTAPRETEPPSATTPTAADAERPGAEPDRTASDAPRVVDTTAAPPPADDEERRPAG